MTKKLGPLPIWAWGLIFGVGGYFLYERYVSSGSSSSTASTTGILDPNAVDPNTGLTYGEEESAAENANAASLGGSGGAVSPDTSSTQSTVPPVDEFGDFLNFLGEWNQFAQALGWQPPVTQSSNAGSVANSAPVTTSSPPTAAPAANTSPAQTRAASGIATAGSALTNLNALYLAPGAKSPNYALVLPKGAPAGAKWAGSTKPGPNWKGIGGGWWVKS